MKAFIILSLALPFITSAVQSKTQPIEVGTVQWNRDHDAALALSAQTGKPVFALFQEVPGCSGCRQFGKEVLSNPELATVIENSFVPLLIYNNRGGKDAALLKQYREPSWNFQVIRFLDEKGKDLIPRKDRVWETKPLAQRMIQVLQSLDREIPNELLKLAGTSAEKTGAISQHCFWTGEMVIGSLTGVLETEAGFLNGREVTKVTYDPAVISLERIRELAAKSHAGDTAYSDLTHYRKAPLSDQKRQLRGTPFAQINMTDATATKVNAWARRDLSKALSYLNEDQLMQIKALN
ncbi:MAG: VPGUxxT family thioredoxin-like (seleno)protein, type 2 [Verrucomicrobiota bacterium]